MIRRRGYVCVAGTDQIMGGINMAETKQTRAELLASLDEMIRLMPDYLKADREKSQTESLLASLREENKVQEFKKPDKVNFKKQNKGLLVFPVVVAACYAVCQLCLSVPPDFILFLGGIVNLIGLCFGLVAYWPLFIPAKLVAIFTPFTVHGFYDTLYGPVTDYVIYFIISYAAIYIGFKVYRRVFIKDIAKEYVKYQDEKKRFDEKEKRRIEKVRADIARYEALLPKERAEAKRLSDEIYKLDHSVTTWVQARTVDELKEMRSYIACMRADTLEEADEIANVENQWRRTLRELADPLHLHETDTQRIARQYKEIMDDMAASEKRINKMSAEIDLEEARAQAAENARKAHNAAIFEDIEWHNMVGDIPDMDGYALGKMMDLEL